MAPRFPQELLRIRVGKTFFSSPYGMKYPSLHPEEKQNEHVPQGGRAYTLSLSHIFSLSLTHTHTHTISCFPSLFLSTSCDHCCIFIPPIFLDLTLSNPRCLADKKTLAQRHQILKLKKSQFSWSTPYFFLSFSFLLKQGSDGCAPHHLIILSRGASRSLAGAAVSMATGHR